MIIPINSNYVSLLFLCGWEEQLLLLFHKKAPEASEQPRDTGAFLHIRLRFANPAFFSIVFNLVPAIQFSDNPHRTLCRELAKQLVLLARSGVNS